MSLCPSCKSKIPDSPNFCPSCGRSFIKSTTTNTIVKKTIAETTKTTSTSDKNFIVCAILALILGELGIHKFYLGYNKQGFIILALFIIGCLTLFIGIGILILLVLELVVFIEFIIYILKGQDNFDETYVYNQKFWF